MEPENRPFEKENHLPNLHFWVPSVNLQGCAISRILYCTWKGFSAGGYAQTVFLSPQHQVSTGWIKISIHMYNRIYVHIILFIFLCNIHVYTRIACTSWLYLDSKLSLGLHWTTTCWRDAKTKDTLRLQWYERPLEWSIWTWNHYLSFANSV